MRCAGGGLCTGDVASESHEVAGTVATVAERSGDVAGSGRRTAALGSAAKGGS